ncbi:MAG TPA: sulfatase-like hydrolase/transferase [Candidatus Binataceae bacterium]|nr:sulfatase-like hydrolase/transferase [Candidatus Binataceae bacterium]
MAAPLRAAAPLQLWWLLFRNLAVQSLLFLLPVLVTQQLHALSFILSTRGAIAELALEGLVIVLLEATVAALLTILLALGHALDLLPAGADGACAGFLATVMSLICVLEFLSPLDGIVGLRASSAVQLAAIALTIALCALWGWRRVFARLTRLNASAQVVVGVIPLLLVVALSGGYGWRSFDPMPHASTAAADPPSRPNIILISLDALSAQDMSLYGYRRPTTPNLQRLAQRSYNFVNFSSTSDFTTPATASLLTGQYPISDQVFQLYGHVPRRWSKRNLAWLLRAHGYTTAAIVTNPAAHPLTLGLSDSFSYLPQPPITHWLYPGTFLLQLRHSLLFDSANALSLFFLKLSGRWFSSFNQHGWVEPRTVFARAESFIGGCPEPYFLWLHLYPPHAPYVNDPRYRGLFLSGSAFTTQSQYLRHLPGPAYSSDQQPTIDQLRARYDESIREVDDDLGEFLSWLRRHQSGNVIVVVTADHGESFSGGWYGHSSPYLRYSETHIPLLLSLPGQERGFDATQDGDLSDVAPTLLALLHIARPTWMDGHSLLAPASASQPWGPSFSMYLARARPQSRPAYGTIAATSRNFHLVWYFPNQGVQLYDVRQDPDQTDNLALIYPHVAAALIGSIRQRFGGQLDLNASAPPS